MTTARPGDVVIIEYPYTDQERTKKRPALIISPKSYPEPFSDVLLLQLTSVRQADAALTVTEWEAAGLAKPTWCRPKIATVFSDLISRRLGRLHGNDYPSVRHAIRLAIDEAFLAR